MPDTTTNVPAADATGATVQPGGETPPAKTREQQHEENVAALRGAKGEAHIEVDPLFDGVPGEGLDPLLEDDPAAALDPLHSLAGADPEPEPEPVVEDTPVDPEPEPETRTAEEIESAAKPEADGRKRININRKRSDGTSYYSATERAALILADEEGIGIAEALARISAPTQQQTTKTETKADPAPKSSEEIGREIKALQAQRKAAATALQTDKADEIQEKIDDLLEQKIDAKQREQEGVRHQQDAAVQHNTAVNESFERVRALNPDALTENSELNVELNLEVHRLKERNPAFFLDPEWPETLYAKIALKKGIAPKAAAKPAPVVKKAPVAPKKAATPIAPGGVTGAAPTPVNQVAALQAELAAAVKSNDLDKIRAANAKIRAAYKAA